MSIGTRYILTTFVEKKEAMKIRLTETTRKEIIVLVLGSQKYCR